MASSSLGKPSSVANGTINIGSSSVTGTLVYTGGGETSDRVINLAGTTGGATLQNEGTGALVFTSAFTATGAGDKKLTLQGANTDNNEISGKIVNNSSANITSVTKAGAGKWILSGANTYSGNTTLGSSSGILGIGNASALGTGVLTISGSTSSFDNSSGGPLTIANAFTMSGGSPSFVGSDDLRINGAVTISGANRTITVNANTLTLGGAIGQDSSARKLTKAGGGTLQLFGDSTYSGGTTITAGTLLVNNTTGSGAGSGIVTVNAAGTLGGNGIISGAVSVSGKISPGNGSIGTLTLGTAPTLSGTAAMEINKSGATLTADKIVLSSGALAYGGTLTVTASGDTLTGGVVFDLFDASSFTGSFSTTTLPSLSSGLNWYVGALATDGTLKVNRAPVATGETISRSGGTNGTKVTIAEVLSNDTDADGDSMSLIGFSATSAQGATISSNGAFLVYTTTSSIDLDDSFTYTNSDGFGGISVGTVTVTTTGATKQTRQLESVSAGHGSFYGVPNTGYTVEYTDSLDPAHWQPLTTVGVEGVVTTDANGLASFTDPAPPEGERFYRITYP
jgi:autotransporter-associated beta strand protein